MFKSGVGGSPFTERNFHPHTTRRFIRRTKVPTPMNNLNRIMLLGNTGRDVKTASTAAGKPVTRLSVATNKRYKDDAGEWKTKPIWHQVVVFGDSANYAAKIKPGSLVFVEGEMTLSRVRTRDRHAGRTRQGRMASSGNRGVLDQRAEFRKRREEKGAAA